MSEPALTTADDDKVRAYMMAVAAALPSGRKEVHDVLDRIAAFLDRHAPTRTLPVQLLAVRRYLRMSNRNVNLEAIWSWTEEEAKARIRQEPTKSLYDEASKVQEKFRLVNPGYRLVVTPVRSLERQIVLWGKNASVGEAGVNLLGKVRRSCHRPNILSQQNLQWFEVFPTLSFAAMSAPSRPARHLERRITDVAWRSISWSRRATSPSPISIHRPSIGFGRRRGWEAKLIKACAGTRLRGPLQHPYESWHWWLG